MVGLCRGRFRPGRRRAPAQPAEEVNLPAGAGAWRIFALVAIEAWETVRIIAELPLVAQPLRGRAGVEIDRGQQGRPCPGCQSTRLPYARERGLQVEVLVERTPNDTDQLGIIEPDPPGIERRCGPRGLTLRHRSEIVERDELRLRPLVVRADRAAGQGDCRSGSEGRRSDDAAARLRGGQPACRGHAWSPCPRSARPNLLTKV